MNLVEELKEYQRQQLNNDMLSEHGLKLVNRVIEECIKIANKHMEWKSPNEPPDTDRDILILYRDKPFDDTDPIIGQAISSYREERLGGKSLGYKDWESPFPYFKSNFAVVGWKELEY